MDVNGNTVAVTASPTQITGIIEGMRAQGRVLHTTSITGLFCGGDSGVSESDADSDDSDDDSGNDDDVSETSDHGS